MNSNQDNEPLGEIAYEGQPGVLNPLALDGTLNVMRTFNRNTIVVATGLLGTVIFAALVLAIQEHHPLPAEVAEKAMQRAARNCQMLSPRSPAQGHDSTRVVRPTIANVRHRSSTRLRFLRDPDAVATLANAAFQNVSYVKLLFARVSCQGASPGNNFTRSSEPPSWTA